MTDDNSEDVVVARDSHGEYLSFLRTKIPEIKARADRVSIPLERWQEVFAQIEANPITRKDSDIEFTGHTNEPTLSETDEN